MSKANTNDVIDEQTHRTAVETLKQMAEVAAGKWWFVWWIGRVPHQHYFLGRVQGDRAEAVRMARYYWPQYAGHMKIECGSKNKNAEPLPNVLCELCETPFPQEYEGQTACRCCDLSI